jgi:hypothetical protein
MTLTADVDVPPAPSEVSRRKRVVAAGPYAAPLVVLSVAHWAGTLSAPALLSAAPLLLVLLSPRGSFLVLVAGREPMVLLLVVATFRLCLADPVNFLIGRRYGPGVLNWASRRGKVGSLTVSWGTRVFDRCGYLAVFLRPNQAMMVLAGARGLRPGATAAAAVSGTVVYLTLLVGAVQVLRRPTNWIIGSCQPYLTQAWATCMSAPGTTAIVGTVVVGAGAGVVLWWRGRTT